MRAVFASERITQDIQIGDTQEKVTRLLGQSYKQLPSDDDVVRLDTDQFSVEIHMSGGSVIFAQILPPDSEM